MKSSYTTKRLILQTLDFNNAHKVLSFYEDNKDFFEPWESKRPSNFYTLAYHRTSLIIEEELLRKDKALRFWVFLKDNTDLIIGTVSFYNIRRNTYSSCQIGYKFDKDHVNMGYAYEAINFSMKIIKKEYNLHRLEAKIMPSNTKSIKLIKKLGFEYEELEPSSIKIMGKWEDHQIYSYIY